MSASRRMPQKLAGVALAAALVSVGAGPSARADVPDPRSRDANYADVWLRLDADRSAIQAWVGGTKSWSALDLGGDLVLTQYYPGAWDPLQNEVVNAALQNQTRAPAVRAELGPALLFGNLFVQPKVGLGYDFELDTLNLVPQATAILEVLFVYLEAWAQFHLYSPFDSALQDSFYARLTALATCDSRFAAGIQSELVSPLKNFQGSGPRSLQVGLAATANVYAPLTLGLFAGVDLASAARYHFPVGRLTATYLF